MPATKSKSVYEASYCADKPGWEDKESSDLAETTDEHAEEFTSKAKAMAWLRREHKAMGRRWRGGVVNRVDPDTGDRLEEIDAIQ